MIYTYRNIRFRTREIKGRFESEFDFEKVTRRESKEFSESAIVRATESRIDRLMLGRLSANQFLTMPLLPAQGR